MLEKTANYFNKLAKKIKTDASKALSTPLQKAHAFHDCIKEELRKFEECSLDIKFGVSLLNTSKIQNIFESSKNSQNQSISNFKEFENKLESIFEKLAVTKIPFEKIINLNFPEILFLNEADASFVHRDPSTKLTVNNRLSVNLGPTGLITPNNRIPKGHDSSIENSCERRNSFLSRRNTDIPSKYLTGRPLNTRYPRPLLNNTNSRNVSPNDPGLEPTITLKLVSPNDVEDTYKYRRARQMNLVNFSIKETLEENLLQNTLLLNKVDPKILNEHIKNTGDKFEQKTSFNGKKSENTQNSFYPVQESNLSKSPIKFHFDILKKVKSFEQLKIDLFDRQETNKIIKPVLEIKLEPVSKISKNRQSRASSKNMSNININLDDFCEKPTSKVSEILKNPKCLKAPHIDLSASRYLIRIN